MGMYTQFLTRQRAKKSCFLVLRKLLLVRFCFVVWVLFRVFSIFCNTVFVNRVHPQHQETAQKRPSWEHYAFALLCGYCSESFQSFVIRYLLIASIHSTKKPPKNVPHENITWPPLKKRDPPSWSWLNLHRQVNEIFTVRWTILTAHCWIQGNLVTKDH